MLQVLSIALECTIYALSLPYLMTIINILMYDDVIGKSVIIFDTLLTTFT